MKVAPPSVKFFSTGEAGRIYQIPVEAFPGFWTHAYLALVEDYRVLIDSGSGLGECNHHLEAGLEAAARAEGDGRRGLEDLTHVLITHGHIDHFGGLSFVRARSRAAIGVHELDRRILTNYEERRAIAARQMERFLVEAGVPQERLRSLLELYRITKDMFHSVPVDFTYEAAGMRLGPFEFLHVPGHCAGHVVIRLHDVLFSGDHVLEGISPHQAPEQLTLSTGLDHYLRSLEALQAWAGGVRLTLGGHYRPIADLPARLEEIGRLHAERLQRVQDFLARPGTVAEIAAELFGEARGYNALLALEEAGAHVEYLYQRGLLGIENLDELESGNGPVAIRYRSLEGRAG